MGILRATLRSIALAALTTAAHSTLVLNGLVGWLCGGPSARLHRNVVQTWARLCSALCGLEVESSGPVPQPPFFLVSNHLSYLDILVLHQLVDGFFLAKSEISSWPFAGRVARTAGTLFIDRDRQRDLSRVLPEIRTVLDSGHGIIVFPEGTSSKGEEVLPFKPSTFEVAARSQMPVHCVALSYSIPGEDPPAYLTACWWGDMPFFSHLLKLLRVPRIHSRVVFHPEPISGDDRKELAQRAEATVSSCFHPVAIPSGAAQEEWRGERRAQ